MIPPAIRFPLVLAALLGALLFAYGDAYAHGEGVAGAKVFIDPETGEILSREQWESLGIESDEDGEAARSSPESSETGRAPKILKARQIDLGNGDYVIVVDTPEEEMVETKVWFDEKGKAHFSCDH